MVFFVCEGCNETLKKNQVQKHANKCRQCHAVSCVDCSTTFYGDTFEAHISCISEAEKYEGSIYKAKKVKTTPQDAWLDCIQKAATNVDAAPLVLRSYLEKLSELSNIPRNRNKFVNFGKNSLKVYNEGILFSLWEHIDSFKEGTIALLPPASAAKIEINDAVDATEKMKPGQLTPVGKSTTSVEASKEEEGGKDKKDKKEKKSKKKKKDKKGGKRKALEKEDLTANSPAKRQKS